MIDAFIRSLIGSWGRAILDFYIANSFVINAIILFYGLLVYLAHICYLSTYRFILKELGLNLEAISKGKKISKRKLDWDRIDWDEAYRAHWFPLITHPKRWLVLWKTKDVLRKLFSVEQVTQLLSSDVNMKQGEKG